MLTNQLINKLINKYQYQSQHNNNIMSCMSCHLCACSLITETKTQLIIYATPPLPHANAKANNYRVRRANTNINANTNTSRQQRTHIDLKHEGKDSTANNNNETVDTTISKFRSASSSQIIKQTPQVQPTISINNNDNNKSNEASQQDSNKENMQRNCQSRLTMDLNSKLSPQNKSKVSQSQIFQLKSVCLSAKSMRVSQAGMLSLHSSTATEKRLETILLQKQNDQLRDELQRLKQKEKQLLKQQQRVKDKNNREICHLKQRSQQIQMKSTTRRKQIDQLKELLQIVKKGH